MDGVLKRKFRISLPEDKCVVKLYDYCNFSSTLLIIPVVNKPLCADLNCHNNVDRYVDDYGGEKISGYYLITDVANDSYGCAIYHSIWRNTYGELVDITPFSDERDYNLFTKAQSEDYYSGLVFDGQNYRILAPGYNLI